MSWTGEKAALLDAACASCGHDDFGDASFHDGLNVLLAALDDRPPPEGDVPSVRALIVQSLAARLITEAGWQANPGYADRDIAAPLVIIGLPRTGTTALHNLLSQDPQFQGIEKWLSSAPKVRPPRATWDDDPQYAAVRDEVAQAFDLFPEMMAAHGVLADDVDECLLPMAQSFTSNWFPSQLDIPLYDAWFARQDETPSFRRYKNVLRLVGLNDDRRWLLKNPSHVYGIDGLLNAFPDACVVQTHRDPRASLASLVNLIANVMEAMGRQPDRDRILARELGFWREAVRRVMAAQDRAPECFVNIRQERIRQDPVGVVRTIYERFGLTLSAGAEAAMRDWADRNAAGAHGGGRDYAPLADCDAVDAAFAAYKDRFLDAE